MEIAEMETMNRRSHIFVIGLFVALIAYTYALRYRSAAPLPAPPLESIPTQIGGYVGEGEEADPEVLDILGADATIFRTYRSGPRDAVWLYIAYFARQHENSQIHSPKHCYPGSGWNIVEEGPTSLVIDGCDVPIKHLVLSNGAERQYVLYWFSGADGIITNEYALKWHQMKNSLFGRSQATAFVRFSTRMAENGGDEARGRLVRFAETLAPHIEEVLRSSDAAPAASPNARGSAALSEGTP
jgi:EpsI family protein